MTEKELYNEYRSSDCKSFTDFLINKIAELKAVERMALYSKMSDQLVKAKEIIKLLMRAIPYGSGKLVTESYDKAEQFLEEVDK